MFCTTKFDIEKANAKLSEHGYKVIYVDHEHNGKTIQAIVEQFDTTTELGKSIYPDHPEQFIDIEYHFEVQPGVYQTSSLNFDNSFDCYIDKNSEHVWGIYSNGSVIRTFEDMKEGGHEYLGTYGVADNIEQVLERYSESINNSKDEFIISYCTLKKKHEPEEGGWRWHKWGAYIGTQNPQCEYLYDEPEIEEVIIFHVHCLK